MTERRKGKLRTLLTGGALGAAIAYFFDPDRGRGRRTKARDWTAGRARRVGRRAERLGRRTGAGAFGAWRKTTHRRPSDPHPDDGKLKEKVESELFGQADVPKGQIMVNVEDGVVFLRGQVDQPGQIEDFEQRVRRIVGVEDVQNLLHLPETPAPNKADAQEASARAGTGTGTAI
jgi:hypothetical protein